MSTTILMIDNYDSFTFNLVQGFRSLGATVVVHRNDQISIADAVGLEKTHLVISPGPGNPDSAGISVALVRALAGKVPILGVCLGHQSIVAAFGGQISRATRQMHGKTSQVSHDGGYLYAGISDPFAAGRYHSLTATDAGLPDELTVVATTDSGEIMGVRHRDVAVEGVQFHPESILTPDGMTLMQNFIQHTDPGAP
ncbi:MAG: aminodeoxychorismate/anthranilate synthase component II [Gammaproteobacteria bacterium]|nr:aminodeoxychorismate/anthranilate synthase component II [Gammaproteobacteria bacterium]